MTRGPKPAPGRRWSVMLRATDAERAAIERRAAEARLPVGRYLVEREAAATRVDGCTWARVGVGACGAPAVGRYVRPAAPEPRALCARHLDLALAAGWRMEPVDEPGPDWECRHCGAYSGCSHYTAEESRRLRGSMERPSGAKEE